MDYATYEVESHVEATHWWFVGRRKLFGQIINTFDLLPTAKVLDIGTSTGTNLRMLRDLGYSNVRGLDLHDEAIQWCAEKGLGKVDKGDICHIPSGDYEYDLVLATDIIEHVDNDAQAISEISRVLKSSARSIITVPAFPSLWGLQDTVSHHKRRYRKEDFIEKLKASGLEVEDCFYFNYLLFFPIWMARHIIRVFKINLQSENGLNPSWVNCMLKKIFLLDVCTSRKVAPPFGVSLLAILKKSA
jgi:2-polyprenyl-3-methyl-5-hydroxy-6-metoxy-1,4-benzoquinol methylase